MTLSSTWYTKARVASCCCELRVTSCELNHELRIDIASCVLKSRVGIEGTSYFSHILTTREK